MFNFIPMLNPSFGVTPTLSKKKFVFQKYSNKLSMKAFIEKEILMKKQEKEIRKAPHFFMYIYQGNSWELKGTQENSREL